MEKELASLENKAKIVAEKKKKELADAKSGKRPPLSKKVGRIISSQMSFIAFVC